MDDSAAQRPAAPARESYSHTGNPAFDANIATRTIGWAAAFFLPHLRAGMRPGMRVLDVGCGPGSITVGLAESLVDADVAGVDLRPEAVEQARALAAERGVANVRFEVGSIYALPFPDGSFDAAFAHAVLMHLQEPVVALREVQRVLRPGGVVGLRDPDLGALIINPVPELWPEYITLRERVRTHNGGDPSVARRHRQLLLEAGFAYAEGSASVESMGTLQETRRYAAIVRALMPGTAQTALAEGWAEQATLDAMLAGVDAWAERPDAFYANIWCETIGWVAGTDGA